MGSPRYPFLCTIAMRNDIQHGGGEACGASKNNVYACVEEETAAMQVDQVLRAPSVPEQAKSSAQIAAVIGWL